MTVHKKRPRTSLRALALILALLLTPVFGSAGEFNISRYIEPNQMSLPPLSSINISVCLPFFITVGISGIATEPPRRTFTDCSPRSAPGVGADCLVSVAAVQSKCDPPNT